MTDPVKPLGPARYPDFDAAGPYKLWKLGLVSYWAKAMLQMLTGIVIVIALFLKAFLEAKLLHCPSLDFLADAPVLAIVGHGLMYAAGFELAHMLFTPGPDEAIQPVILGLASAVLLIISDDVINWADAIIVPLLCLSIGALFLVEHIFIEPKGTLFSPTPPETGNSPGPTVESTQVAPVTTDS
jgi:hypothetical protein